MPDIFDAVEQMNEQRAVSVFNPAKTIKPQIKTIAVKFIRNANDPHSSLIPRNRSTQRSFMNMNDLGDQVMRRAFP